MLEYVNRRGTHSFKWDGVKEGYDDLIAMSTADMDFKTPECVRKALGEYADLGTMGYYMPPDSFYQAFIDWEEKEHGYRVKKEWIRETPGVVPAFFWLLHLLVKPGDAVLIQTPAYRPFYEAIEASGAVQIDQPLSLDGGHWYVDMADFENKIRENNVKFFMLCSPHNPTGRVWTKEELQQMLEICRKYNVFVLADEIHQDLVMPGQHQVSAASLGDYGDMMLTMTAASKTFNLASTQNSVVMIENELLRNRFDEMRHKWDLPGGNAFGYIAAEAAYRGGREWLDELLAQVWENYLYLKKAFGDLIPMADLEGTYLAWLDLSKVLNGRTVKEFTLRDCHISCNTGDWFGEAYKDWTRLNLATSLNNVKEAAARILRAAKQ